MRMDGFCSRLAVLALAVGNVFAMDFPYSEWNFATYEGAYATFFNGTVSVANGGSDYWNVQLTRRNIELQFGKTYELKFFLQGVGAQKKTEIRIGRDGAPYDAFAEFGEIVATESGRTLTRTFKMQSGDVNDARLEFNFGKSNGSVFFSDVSLNCLDCKSYVVEPVGEGSTVTTNGNYLDYVVIADEVDFRDYSMALGNVFGSKLELGADSKIYGDVESSNECFLRERAHVSGNLRFVKPCTEQNNVFAASKNKADLQKPMVSLSGIMAGFTHVSVGIDESITLAPGNYDSFYANHRSKVKLTSGTYNFSNFVTEPDAEFTFDMTTGPITISVAKNVRFGDRIHSTIIGGNADEVTWKIGGESVNLGTDGIYFGKIVAPGATVRIPSRTHLVGSVYAHKFLMEPQSTVSQPPRAEEISHSEEHFGPFFESGVYRYRSQLPLETSSVEMFVYVKNATFKVNGKTSTTVNLPSTKESVTVSVSQDLISGFPMEAFTTNYVFDFVKNEKYRVYWNPQMNCKDGCDGSSAATAVGTFAEALKIAKTTGREINMVGGVWDVSDNFTDGVVPWKVGFELVGYTGDIWDLNSELDLPHVNLGKSAHVEVEGRSPRSMTGLHFSDGFNLGDGGAIHSNVQRLNLKNVAISSSNAGGNGGGLAANGILNLETVHFTSNGAAGNGGAVATQGETNMQNVIFKSNASSKNGGAVELDGGNTYIGNAIFYNNSAAGNGGAINNDNAGLNLWNATLFANGATVKNGAIAGTAKGTVGNSIFWKNVAGGCTGACADEIVAGYTAKNSSFSKSYAGTGIYVGDPKFANESNPEGENEFMNYDAGINLDEKSHLLDKGIKGAFTPLNDILEMEREKETVALGAYAYALTTQSATFGVLDDEGKVVAADHSVPLINAVMGEYHRKYLKKSPYARVWKATIERNKYTKKMKKARVKLWTTDKDGNRLTKEPVEFDVYRNGDENGQCIFQTMTETEGKPILFTMRPQDAGNHEHAIVIYMKDVTDKFEYEARK